MKSEDRTKYVMHALGWQGGTVHQIADAIGIDSHSFLYDESEDNGHDQMFHQGWFAVRTCTHEKFMEMVPAYRGRLQWWLGVARGQELKEQGI